MSPARRTCFAADRRRPSPRRAIAPGGSLRSWCVVGEAVPGEFRLYRAIATEQFILDDHDARLPVRLQ